MYIKHFYLFNVSTQEQFKGKKLSKDNWDLLRNDGNDMAFSLEDSIEAYEKNCMEHNNISEQANIVCKKIEEYWPGSNRVVSCGAGKAILEWHMKRINPLLRVECTDYTPQMIDALKSVFINVDAVYTFDMMDTYKTLMENDNPILMMNRVSTEFSKKQWIQIFNNIYDSDIKHIIYIPTGLDNWKTMGIEIYKRLYYFLTRKNATFCGWMYSEKEFVSLFGMRNNSRNGYRIIEKYPYNDSAIFFLEKNG